ncbi:MAG: hypothetical protein GPJ54_18605 [Candidatus Heimdallarchaeota archaeon]|nr:hypothetical protein [Candidatus Heimdallarchaeota archaeon]
MKVLIYFFLILLALSSLHPSKLVAQTSSLQWDQSKIIEYSDSEEYRLQLLSTYSTSDGIYVYYASDDDTTRENIIALFDYNGGSQFWNLGTIVAKRSIHFMKYENSMYLVRRNSYTKTEIFSLMNEEWVSIDIQTTVNGISKYMVDEENGIIYTFTYDEEVLSYNLKTKQSSKITKIIPEDNVESSFLGVGLATTGMIYGFLKTTTTIPSHHLSVWSFNLTSKILQLNSISNLSISIASALIYKISTDELLGILQNGDSFVLYKIYSNLTLISDSAVHTENINYGKIHLIQTNETNWLFTVSGSDRKISYYQINDDLTLGPRISLAGTIFTNGIPLAVNSAFTPTVVYPTLKDDIVSLHLATLADFTYSFDFVSFVVDETSILPYIVGGLIIVTTITIIWIRRRKTKDLMDS